MKVVDTKEELRALLAPVLPSARVLVPTMGALHEGHLSLIRLARRRAGPNGAVVVSIFVNPIQFDRAEDLERYPRTLADDLRLCEAEGADVVFVPEVAAMYAPDRSVSVVEESLSSGLCGAARPGHFNGVCTVVLKLFLLTGCGAAVFGDKDFQQLAVIRRMVRDLDVPVEVISCPTVREPDGLAMSSRNVRLSPEHRADAPRIWRSLQEAAGIRPVPAMIERARQSIEASGQARIDYLELVDAETLEPVGDPTRPAILAVAVFYGNVRIIDHVGVEP